MVKCALVFSAVASILSLAGTEAFGVGNGNAFIKGLNQPWGDGDYGHYLAAEPANPSWGYSYTAAETTTYLKAFNSLKATFWRVWLFEAGQGLTVSNLQVSGISSTFFTNFDNLLSQAGSYGVKVYPTLFNGQVTQGDMNIFANFITSSSAQQQIINNVIIPFAQRYKGNSNIGAIQIWNELNNWCDPYFGSQIATVQQCASFVSAVVTAIKGVDSSRLVSVSQIYISDSYHPVGTSNLGFKGTGVDFYDIHVYNDDGSLPQASALNLDKPVILGEFGELTGQGAASQSTIVGNFLSHAKSQGWAGALYWTLGEPGQNPQYSGCSDSTLIQNLYACNGQPRQAWTTFQSY